MMPQQHFLYHLGVLHRPLSLFDSIAPLLLHHPTFCSLPNVPVATFLIFLPFRPLLAGSFIIYLPL